MKQIAEGMQPPALEKGLWPGISDDIYRAFDAVSYSDLKNWVKPFKGSTDRMRVGKAVHVLVLEPDLAKPILP